MLKDIIVIAYNLFEIVTWTAVLVLIALAAYNANSYEEFGDSYNKEDSKLRMMLWIAQGASVLDIIFAAIRWTPNSLNSVAPQILSRLLLVFLVFPLVPLASESQFWLAKQPIIQVAVLAWAITEPIRFSYYTFKSL